MKNIVTALTLVLLGGCATGRAAPTALADGATIGMWTARPTDEVRACVDQVLRQTPSRYKYEVTANDTRKTYMTTTVSGFTDGNVDPAGERIAALCLPAK